MMIGLSVIIALVVMIGGPILIVLLEGDGEDG
jgi:hypothetical protein